MLRIYFPLTHKVDTVRHVKFESSSCTYVDAQTPPLPSDLADTPPTIIQELRPETPPPTTQTTTPSTQQTLPGSYPETPVQSRHPPLIEVPSPPTNIQDYLEVSDDELESERDSVPTNPIAGPSTPLRNTSTSTPSPPKSFKTARLDEFPETPKLPYKSYPKRDHKQTQGYSEHGFVRLVVEPTTCKEANASLDADSWQSAILEEYRSIQEAGTCTLHDMSDLLVERRPLCNQWVFKVKHNADGSVERYYARIVAKGYSQIESLTYDETFVPLTRYDFLRLIIALTTHVSGCCEKCLVKENYLLMK